MRLIQRDHSYSLHKVKAASRFLILAVTAALWLAPGRLAAQTQNQTPASPSPTPPAAEQPDQQQGTGEAGGPGGDVGPIAVPKKKVDEAPKKEDVPKAPKK